MLAPLAELEIKKTDSPALMAALNQISEEDARLRFSNDNLAFVAYWNGSPAACWMPVPPWLACPPHGCYGTIAAVTKT